jgi:hypothetical protein
MSRYLQPHLKCGCPALCCAWKAVAAKIDVKQRWLGGDRDSRSIRSRAAEYRPLVTRPELEFRRPDSVNGRYRLRNWIGLAHCRLRLKPELKTSYQNSPARGLRPCHGHGRHPAPLRSWDGQEPPSPWWSLRLRPPETAAAGKHVGSQACP